MASRREESVSSNVITPKQIENLNTSSPISLRDSPRESPRYYSNSNLGMRNSVSFSEFLVGDFDAGQYVLINMYQYYFYELSNAIINALKSINSTTSKKFRMDINFNKEISNASDVILTINSNRACSNTYYTRLQKCHYGYDYYYTFYLENNEISNMVLGRKRSDGKRYIETPFIMIQNILRRYGLYMVDLSNPMLDKAPVIRIYNDYDLIPQIKLIHDLNIVNKSDFIFCTTDIKLEEIKRSIVNDLQLINNFKKIYNWKFEYNLQFAKMRCDESKNCTNKIIDKLFMEHDPFHIKDYSICRREKQIADAVEERRKNKYKRFRDEDDFSFRKRNSFEVEDGEINSKESSSNLALSIPPPSIESLVSPPVKLTESSLLKSNECERKLPSSLEEKTISNKSDEKSLSALSLPEDLIQPGLSVIETNSIKEKEIDDNEITIKIPEDIMPNNLPKNIKKLVKENILKYINENIKTILKDFYN
jgi:hypothetical protein